MPHDSLRRRGVIAYLALCFGWSWTALLVARLLGAGLDSIAVQLATVALVPAASAIIVRRWVTREGFADAGLRLRLRESWRHYVVALLIPVGVLLVGLVLARVLGVWDGEGVDPGSILTTVATGPVVAIVTAPLFWGEEFGWTAYLRDRLLPGRPVATTVVAGVIWGVWHFPLPWVGYFGSGTSWVTALIAMALWLPLSVLLEMLIGWLWAQTRSVWPGAVLHGGCNLLAAVGLEQALGSAVGQSLSTVLYCLALVPFVLAVVLSGRLRRRGANV